MRIIQMRANTAEAPGSTGRGKVWMVPRDFAGPGSWRPGARRLGSSRALGVEQSGVIGGRPIGRQRHPEVGEGGRRGHPAAEGPLEEALLQEVGLVDVLHRLGL